MIKNPFEFPGLVIHHNLKAAKHILEQTNQDRFLIEKCLEEISKDLERVTLKSEQDLLIENIVELNLHALNCEIIIQEVNQFVKEYNHNLN